MPRTRKDEAPLLIDEAEVTGRYVELDDYTVSFETFHTEMDPARGRQAAGRGRDRDRPGLGVWLRPRPGPARDLAAQLVTPRAAARQDPHSSTSLLTVAQLRAVPATAAEVGPPTLARIRRRSLRGYPSGVCR
jgi:hypothetical protein